MLNRSDAEHFCPHLWEKASNALPSNMMLPIGLFLGYMPCINAHSSILAWRIPGTGSWWAAVYGVTQSWTWLSSSSSSSSHVSKWGDCHLFLGCWEAFFKIVKKYLLFLFFIFFMFKKAPPLFFLFLFFSFIFISCRLITLQYCSGLCHTLTWISRGFTCIPHPDPPSHLPLYPIPLGLPSAPGPSICFMHPTWAGDLFHPR